MGSVKTTFVHIAIGIHLDSIRCDVFCEYRKPLISFDAGDKYPGLSLKVDELYHAHIQPNNVTNRIVRILRATNLHGARSSKISRVWVGYDPVRDSGKQMIFDHPLPPHGQ
jgi:hypothetical protein